MGSVPEDLSLNKAAASAAAAPVEEIAANENPTEKYRNNNHNNINNSNINNIFKSLRLTPLLFQIYLTLKHFHQKYRPYLVAQIPNLTPLGATVDLTALS